MHAIRSALRTPGVSSLAVLALALGIGANTAIFSLANAALFRPLPYPDYNRLAFIWQTNERNGDSEGRVSYPNYADWRSQSSSFDDMAFFASGKAIFSGAGDPERIPGALVSTNFFKVMGVSPVLGRSFTTEEQLPGHANVMVISYQLWRSRFNGDPKVLGSTVAFGNDHDTIIGVMPAGFAFPDGSELWKPRIVSEFMKSKGRQYPLLEVVGRLKPDASWGQAQTELDTISRRLADAYPNVDGGIRARIVPMRQQLSGKVREGLLVLWGAIFGVLLIACLNTGNLVLARAAGRQKEIAIRLSLGASVRHIMKHFLLEGMVLAVAAAVGGLLLAWLGVRLVSTLNPEIAKLGGSILDVRVLAYTVAITGFTAIACGVLPSLSFLRLDVNQSLKETGAGTAARSTQDVRSILIAAEVALAFVLLTGSGLLVRSLWQIIAVNPGFDAAHVLTLHVYWANAPANSNEQNGRNVMLSEMMSRVRQLSGVVAIGTTSNVLFPGEMYKVPFVIEGEAAPGSGQRTLLPHGEATPDYFRAMGIPRIRGRFFDEHDVSAPATPASVSQTQTSVPVAIINETMARRYWPNQDAIGKRFRLDDPNFKSPWFTIVGIAGDIHQDGLEKSAGLMAYLPSSGEWSDDIVIRSTGEPASLALSVREIVHSLDKNLVVDNMRPASDLLAIPESQRSFNAMLLAALAAIALILAVVGVYGTVSYWVRQRTQEIGVRIALGAQPVHIVSLVIRRGMALVIAGLVLGIAGALAATRLLATLLYGVSASDPVTFASIAVLLALVAVVACYLPARRAVQVDPLNALRCE